MPSSSAKQANFMRAIAHSPSFAKKVGVKQSVGKDFEMADKKTKKFAAGGVAKQLPSADAMGSMNMAKGGKVMKMGKGLRAGHKAANGIAKKGKTRDLREPMDGGDAKTVGLTSGKCGGGKVMKKAKGGSIDGIAQKGKTKTAYPAMKKGGKC